jgi:hypothetical protein
MGLQISLLLYYFSMVQVLYRCIPSCLVLPMSADFPVLPRINPTRGAGEVRNPELEEIKEKLL